jgi:plastocyanin
MMNKEPERSMHRSRTLFYLFACVCVIAFIVYAGPGAAHEDNEGSVVVHMSDGGFEPKSVEISAGDTVVFENVDQKPHWPASDPHPTHTDYPGFDPKKPVEPGSEWSFAFDKPGDWTYHDHQAPYLKGEIVVLDDGQTGASGNGDQAEEKSGVEGFLASIEGFLLDTYRATTSAFASEEKGSASDDEDGAEEEEAASNDADTNELSRERFEEAKDKYAALVRDQDPKVALDQLRDDIQTDDALSRSCHAIVHEIGHEAYKKYEDFGEAMKYQSEMCNSGYLHGIIESHFSESEDVFADMQTLCDPYPPKSFLSWQCYHGLGHGLMYYTANDLPRSLEMCDAFESRTDSSNCTNGVFMENFSADQKLHLSDYLKESDPFYPCAEQTERHKRNCYTYAPTYYLSLNKNDYVGALEWCKGAEASFVSTCVFGVGAQTMKEKVNDPESVESICMNSDAELVASCIKGMVDLYANHHGSVKPVEQLCGQLQVSNRQTCYDTLKKYYKLFDS